MLAIAVALAVIAVFMDVCTVLPSYRTSLVPIYGVPSFFTKNLVFPETVVSKRLALPPGEVMETATEPDGGVKVLPVFFHTYGAAVTPLTKPPSIFNSLALNDAQDVV